MKPLHFVATAYSRNCRSENHCTVPKKRIYQSKEKRMNLLTLSDHTVHMHLPICMKLIRLQHTRLIAIKVSMINGIILSIFSWRWFLIPFFYHLLHFTIFSFYILQQLTTTLRWSTSISITLNRFPWKFVYIDIWVREKYFCSIHIFPYAHFWSKA